MAERAFNNRENPSCMVSWACGAGLYLFGLAAVGLIVAFQLALAGQLGGSTPYLTVYPVVILLSLYLGIGPGLTAALAGAVATELFLMEPLQTPHVDTATVLRSLIFVASAGILGYVGQTLHRERDRAVTTLERITDAFLALDHQWRLTYVNTQAQAFLGSSSNLRGKNIWECMPEACGSLIHQKCKEAAQSQLPAHFEAFYAPHARWYEVHAYPGGEGLSVYFSDITEHKQAEEALRESRERFRTLAEASFEGICISRDGIILDCNDQLAEMVGCTRKDLLGQSIPDLLSPYEWRDRVMERIRQGIETKLGQQTYYRNGVRRCIEARGKTVLAQGRPVRISVLQDVTDMKQAEEERQALLDAERAARSEAERLNRLKDEFLATVSHELRSPLNAILGWARLLVHGRVQEVGHAADIIERNASVLAQLVGDLLDMGRITSGKIRLRLEQVNVESLVRGVVESFQIAAQAKDITIDQQFDVNLAALQCDQNRIEQVLYNLLSNAVKFTQAGGHIKVRAEQKEAHVVIAVEDNGKGICPEFLPHVFEKFIQADTSTARQQGGLGLGLSIVKHLVELHGGIAEAQSDGLGAGSRFTITLPLLECMTSDEPGSRLDSAQGLQIAHAASQTLPPGLTVLAVDDDPDACELMRRILLEAGASVFTATSARDGLEALIVHKPDVLVCDIGMPGEDGYDLVRQVRSSGHPCADIPCLAFTAMARPEDRDRALRMGFDGHLAKSVDPAELVRAIRELALRQPKGKLASASLPATHADAMGEPARHILLAEDHASIAEMLKTTLESRGYDVSVTDSVDGAVKVARESPVDLLLSDLRLRDGTGWDLLGRLCEVRPVPGIAMSGYSDPVYVQRSKSAGFAEHLIKPVDEDVLLAAIRRALCSGPSATRA